MKNKPITKLLVSGVVVILALVSLVFLRPNNSAKGDGSFKLIIIDLKDDYLFEDDLIFFKDESFYDVLKRNFEIICADRNYNPDCECSYEFNLITHKERVVLGIKDDSFELITSWQNDFLAFYEQIDDNLVLLNYGVNNISFYDDDIFVIKHERVLN